MQTPLAISHLLERARNYFPTRTVASVRPDRSIKRFTYGEFAERTARLANALRALGVQDGDRVATLCWNHHEHLECYYAVPSMGAIVHTLNIRLNPTEIGWIANDAQDTVVIVDASLLGLFEQFRPAITSLKHVIVVRDTGAPLPPGYLDYEVLLAAERPEHAWPTLDENTAAMICYTSGTTGDPKGALYTHRTIVLHALVVCMPDVIGFAMADTVLPVVPLFHACGWGLPYAGVLVGANMVLPGPYLDPASLLGLMEGERVTVAAGVPTIWLGILALLDADPQRYDLSAMRVMAIGGSAAPASLIAGFKTRHSLDVLHAWGMTETSPVGTVARVKPHLRGDAAQELALCATQGLPVPLVDTRHVDDGGRVLAWDGHSIGELEVRGPWVSASYLHDHDPSRWSADGWFKTGDEVTVEVEGYVTITDRAKDVIKSGGEWISSVALENALMAHPAIAEAAVFAATHPKWTERPVAAIVVRPGAEVTDAELAAHLAATFSKIQMPDAFVRVAQVPRTSTGKFLKSALRAQYGAILMPNG